MTSKVILLIYNLNKIELNICAKKSNFAKLVIIKIMQQ